MEIVGKRAVLSEKQRQLELSKDSREVLQLAVEEATTQGRSYFIDTADLLVGLSQVGTTGQRLVEIGISVEKIREIKEQLGGYDYFNRLQSPAPIGTVEKWSQLPRTQRMHKIGQMITRRAIEAKRDLVEPEDILAAVVSEGQGLGAKIVRQIVPDNRMLNS